MRLCTFGAPKKGQYPKRGPNLSDMEFLVFQVEIPSNNEYRPNLKPNGWKFLHLWPNALSGTQNCPIPIGTFWGKIRNLGPYHLLHIITKEKPAKFQSKRTAGSKVLRLSIFCAPKRSKPQKGLNWVRMKFSYFPGGDTPKWWAQTKFQAKPV